MILLKDNRRRATRAFTLIELIAVMVLVAIAAVTVAPVMGRADSVRRAGMRDEVERRLLTARSHAMTTGRPSGVRFVMADQSAEMLEIIASGAAPTAMASASGQEPMGSMFANAEIADADLDDGDVYDTIWFSNEGAPHFRTGAGVYVGGIARDAVITIHDGGAVAVRATTGLIE